jgi:hypothetical protein
VPRSAPRSAAISRSASAASTAATPPPPMTTWKREERDSWRLGEGLPRWLRSNVVVCMACVLPVFSLPSGERGGGSWTSAAANDAARMGFDRVQMTQHRVQPFVGDVPMPVHVVREPGESLGEGGRDYIDLGGRVDYGPDGGWQLVHVGDRGIGDQQRRWIAAPRCFGCDSETPTSALLMVGSFEWAQPEMEMLVLLRASLNGCHDASCGCGGCPGNAA